MKENEICGTGINAILTLLIFRIPCFSLILGDCSLPNISASIFANIFRTLIDRQQAISCISSNQHGKLSLSFLRCIPQRRLIPSRATVKSLPYSNVCRKRTHSFVVYKDVVSRILFHWTFFTIVVLFLHSKLLHANLFLQSNCY